MSLTISFELSDHDLDHFRQVMQATREAVRTRGADEVVQGAHELLRQARAGKPPTFVGQRLDVLETLIAMLTDEGWAMPDPDAELVRSALAYFVAPVNVIPDSEPVLGFLDDAIMIELCARELQPEIDAYRDFCEFREYGAQRRGLAVGEVGRADWLDSRRDELQARMHRRRNDLAGSYSQSTYRGGGYGTPGWRPELFRAR